MEKIKEKKDLAEILCQRINEDWKNIEPESFLGFINPKISQSLGFERLPEMLKSGKKLKVKFGTDPTAGQLHMGHIVPMILLEMFQKAGHHIDFIVGDFTAMVGDPSGRDAAREVLTRDQIKENMRSFSKQAGRFVSIGKMKVHNNSSWLEKISLSDIFSHLQKISATAAMQRDDFRKRAEKKQPVSIAELIYGILMGFDSLELKTDVEIGGVDQFLNIVQCRTLMENAGVVPEIGLFTPLIEGTDGSGRKMSKSFGNAISATASFEDKFGKVMSIPDSLILSWFKAFTFIHEEELPKLESFIKENPLEAKKILGVLLIALETKSLEDGEKERKNFERKFSQKDITEEDCESVPAKENLFASLRQKFSSNSELRRLFEQNGVKTIDGKILNGEEPFIGIVRVGKRKIFNIQ
ncbi:MAG: tyrosine--tRNA ligase [Candidatus Paceibacterota bacterium]|jgi:tyrosyl-tRNA synthetase|nr:tyrosine--tRNA ligase [Candidatus Paceibacterota bacterium]MDD4830579.1 tyrosine--tRNA ligase [Candidatus Paceibacterota bacterium]MDD4874954.1 tyrosine--tRNA ligase [Candidatus Paceibacterota bacterium]